MQKLLLVFAVAVAARGALAATNRVASVAELQQAIGKAHAGDQIVMAAGAYTVEERIKIGCAGAEGKAIIIRAERVGAVEIKGATGFTIESTAAHVVVEGFKFTHAAGTIDIAAGAHHCRLTRNVFELEIAKGKRAPYVTVHGDDCEIDHNTFQHKATEGQMLYVEGPGRDGMAQRTRIHHNYFFDFKPSANNCSALHIGHSARSLTPAHSLVEENLFIDCRGENEGAICNKSCDNVYRYNTFGSGTTELSLRHGNRCEVYGNHFVGSTGLRIFGDDHRIFSNEFEGCRPAIAIGNGDTIIPPGQLTGHDRPDRVQIIFNTLANNIANVQMSGRSNGLGATELVFANNIIMGGNRAVAIAGPITGAKWANNILWNNEGGPGDIPKDGFTSADPMLEQGTDGTWRLRDGSPAIDHATSDYKAESDIDGQARNEKPDIGADEFSNQPISHRRLSISDVGPQAP
jgi:poly(beta-D-mannuronate) lyase